MTIADEIGIPVDNVNVTLADARPELVFNQLTGGSNSMHSIFTPVRTAAAIARAQMLHTAAIELGGHHSQYTIRDGLIRGPGGCSATFAQLGVKAAMARTRQVAADAWAGQPVHDRRDPPEADRRP